ncbi:MAG: hypothetical protein Q7K38_00260 [Candidatus Wildermuthbacteria bacterium]|nr:hypothetical protein [Candidatus Wildermuthbacteria bacterium]
MTDYILKILDDIREGRRTCGEVKKLLAGGAEEYGKYEKSFELQENVWEDIKKKDNLDENFLVSASELYRQSLIRPKELLYNYKIMTSMDSTAAIIDTAGTVSLSGVAYSYNDNVLPKSHEKLRTFIIQGSHRSENYRRLAIIDKSLAEEYNNAWASLHTASEDPTRGPMFLIREVVDKLFNRFAPFEEAKKYCEAQGIKDFLHKENELKRFARIKYIASLIPDKDKREAFLNLEKPMTDIYSLLCSAHKPGQLNHQKCEDYLYQADTFIKLILDSFDRSGT